ncbi:MAG: hypothetical protein WC319_06660 [Candidatus Paceibacterota bacterium]|jgi:hypothetical protein
MKTILFILTVVFTTLSGFACDCIVYPVESYINKVDYIFTGKVIELLGDLDSTQYIDIPENRIFFKNKSYIVRVVIIERLKTGQLKNDTLEFDSDYTNCDPVYELGKSYLFFAEKAKDNKFKMAHCTPWGEIKESAENIEILRKKMKE